MTPDRARELLERFPDVTIAVVGDFFLDKYLVIEEALTELSLETGLEAYQVVAKRLTPGAAGAVTNNLTALEVGCVLAIGFTGDDGEGYELRQGLAATGVDGTHLLIRPDLFTPTYTKPMLRDTAGQERELNRLDIKNRKATPADLEDEILRRLRECLPHVHGVIIADQIAERHLGVITDRVREGCAELALQFPQVLFLADSRANIGLFRNVMLKPNRYEAARACGFQGAEKDVPRQRVVEDGTTLARLSGRPVFVTLGPEGVLVVEDERATQVSGIPVPPPVDIVGAGDSATAGIMASLCAGASLAEAAAIGNCVASLTVQQIGTTGTATRKQVAKRFESQRELFASI